MPDVILERVTKSYGATRASDGVDLSISDGEFVTLLGPSGCGKTTLLRCVAGLENPDAGRIKIHDTVVAEPATGTFVPTERRGLGMVFQNYALWPHMNVYDNVAYPLKLRRSDRSVIGVKVREMLEMVGLDHHEKRLVSELSGGQQQRVALARALVNGSDLVLYDEPLSNLDTGMRLSMRQEIRRVHADLGTTSILVTHDQEEALAVSDRVVVMRAGTVVQQGGPQEVFAEPANSYVAEFLGFENIFSAAASGPNALVLGDGAVSLDWPAHTAPTTHVATSPGLAVKASHLRLGPQVDLEKGGIARGRVQTRSFIGDRTDYVVEVNGVHLNASVTMLPGELASFPATGELTSIQVPAAALAPLADAPA